MAAELKEIELEHQALTWPQKVKAIAIRDQDSYDRMAELLIGIVALRKEIIEYNQKPKKLAHETWKEICAREKRGLDPLDEAENIAKRSMGLYVQQQERIRLEAQRKAEEEARRLEEEARLALAIEAEKQGATEETVKEIIETPMPMQMAAVASTFRPAAGIATGRKPVYKWRVIDENQVPREYLMLNEVKVNGIVRAMGMTAKIPGIQVYEDVPNISVRGAR